MSHAKKNITPWGWLAVVVIATAVFIWFAWFVLNPKTPLAIASSISFGIGLTVGNVLLAHFDSAAKTRLGRFGVDVLIGGLMLLFIYLFMLGFTFDIKYVVTAVAFVLIFSGLFAIRQPKI